jgi:hypothetical protein
MKYANLLTTKDGLNAIHGLANNPCVLFATPNFKGYDYLHVAVSGGMK